MMDILVGRQAFVLYGTRRRVWCGNASFFFFEKNVGKIARRKLADNMAQTGEWSFLTFFGY